MKNSLYFILLVLVFASCSTTARLAEDETLYTGIQSVNVDGKTGSDAESNALLEMEGVLDYAPNNSFFGSSYIRTPLPIGLWIYNSMASDSISGIKKWFFKAFSATPRTVSSASPATRVKVASNTLQNYGYFNNKVDFRIIDNKKNPRKQKIAYDVTLGRPYMLDSIKYAFTGKADSIIQSNMEDTYLREGNQFSVPDLQNEKLRLSKLFHDNGYYFFRHDYVKYLADSINSPGKVKLMVTPDASMPLRAKRQWRFGKIAVFFRDNTRTLTTRRGTSMYDDTIHRPRFDVAFQGKKVPVRIPVVMRNFKFWTGMKYSEDRVNRTITQLNNLNSLSNIRFSFTPADSTDSCSVLDVRLDATMDKLIDTQLEFNFTQKSNMQVGPDASLTISRRNAFRNGEKLSLTLRGSYYWQVRNRNASKDYNNMDSYDWGVDLKLDYPWIVFPYFLKRNFYRPTSTNFVASFTRTNMAHYMRYNQFSLGVEYKFHKTDFITHTFSPLRVEMLDVRNDKVKTGADEGSVGGVVRIYQNEFVPSMQYSFEYDNSTDLKRRFFTNFTFTFKEAGNVISAIKALAGVPFNSEAKTFIFQYYQFLKGQVELRNKYMLNRKSCIATRMFAGALWNYYNFETSPLSDVFYAGGAYSLRAFPARSVGPGHIKRYEQDHYILHRGDMRIELNAEYRFPLVGNLNGALFVDAGNVWVLGAKLSDEDIAIIGGTREDYYRGEFRLEDFLKELALGTGFGFRYDMQFLVLRLDFGIAIHAPYDTGKRGYYNIPKFFKDGVGINFAVGYPF